MAPFLEQGRPDESPNSRCERGQMEIRKTTSMEPPAKSRLLLLLAATAILMTLGGCPEPGSSATDTYACSNTCDSYYSQGEAYNGICEDGGSGSVATDGYGCYYGTDCADCGTRSSSYYLIGDTGDEQLIERGEPSPWGIRFR